MTLDELKQELKEKLEQKNWYQYLCDKELKQEAKKNFIDAEKVCKILNKYKIFQHTIDKVDFEIFELFHEILHIELDSYYDYIDSNDLKIISNNIDSKYFKVK